MTGNKSSLTDYQEYDGGFVAFAGSSKGGKITGKGKFRTGNLDFEDVYFVKEHKFNLFSVSQMCDKKNSVLFTKNEWFILSSDFKLPDENQVMLKIHRKDNMYSFDLKNIVPSRNYEMNQLCGIKGIKREFSNARTPQQNRVAERKNKTLIEAARTTLADSLLPIPFWAEAVNTACRTPIVSFMRHFGYPVTILNTLDHLVKFDGKADEGVLVVSAGNRTNGNAGIETNSDAGQAGKNKVPDQEYILLPLMHTSSYVPSSPEEDVSSLNDDAADKKTEQESTKEEA
ncbi:putative ribonuclease H-like domain-containing protein [Tanacetum coccineum]|uniref:Ribonuclease H-like domain-containing protein n=1 Tax=Tanacetum coccineum TaxID=301880 RepID=A0ABQ5DU02_9ASTR